MSDVVWQAVIAGSVTVVLAVLHQRDSKKLDRISETGEKTHTLVNSNMGAQLKLNATVTHRLAMLTGDPVDEEAAVLSKKMLDEHEAKQAVVDSTTK
jgi:hypothetical protein